jgi:predicted secreted Zn-dependent protease
MKTEEEIEKIAEEQCYTMESKIGFAWGYTQCQEDMADISKVTRFEVIDEHGRAYTQKDCKVELSYQDDGRTLKVFINSLNKQD